MGEVAIGEISIFLPKFIHKSNAATMARVKQRIIVPLDILIKFFRFFVFGMFLALFAVFFKHQFFFLVKLVFTGDIILTFAHPANKRN